MFDFSLTITKVDNGFLIKWVDEISENNFITRYQVFEDNEQDNFGEHKALVRALYNIVEYFGLLGSKHDEKRIRIELAEKEN